MQLSNKSVRCPNCGVKLDAATGVTDINAVPSKGDVSVCFHCGELLEYGDDFTLKRLSPRVWFEILSNDENAYSQLQLAREVILSRK